MSHRAETKTRLYQKSSRTPAKSAAPQAPKLSILQKGRQVVGNLPVTRSGLEAWHMHKTRSDPQCVLRIMRRDREPPRTKVHELDQLSSNRLGSREAVSVSEDSDSGLDREAECRQRDALDRHFERQGRRGQSESSSRPVSTHSPGSKGQALCRALPHDGPGNRKFKRRFRG